MAKKRSGLGKGLDALIPGGEFTTFESDPDSAPADESGSISMAGKRSRQGGQDGIQSIAIDSIITNPRQPRTIFDPADLEDLAASIRIHGIIQPLIISPGENGEHTLIAGERRLQAAKLAGLEKVPTVSRTASDQELLELALIENIQRTDLTPLENAEAFQHLADSFGLSQQQIAERVGKSRVAVANTMRLLKLASATRAALVAGKIREGHARALLPLTHPEAQAAALQTVLRKNLTVRQTEDFVRKLVGQIKTSIPAPTKSADVKALEDRLRTRFGTRVVLSQKANGGSLTIHYYSDEELDTLLTDLLPDD